MMSNLDNLGYVDEKYLRKSGEIVFPLKKRSYELMEVDSDSKILDVGCGPGIDTLALSKIISDLGHITGLDLDGEMIDLANKKAAMENLSHRVTHDIGDANLLPYDDNTFDSVRCERLLQHLESPEKALGEMIRVAKKDGYIVVADTDLTTMSIDCDDFDLELKMRRVYSTASRNGYIGRNLYRMFKEYGLSKIRVEIFPFHITDFELARFLLQAPLAEKKAIQEKYISSNEIDVFYKNLSTLASQGLFFAYGNMLLVVARKA